MCTALGYFTNSVVTNGTFLYNEAGCVTHIARTGTGGYSDSLALEWDKRYRLVNVDAASSRIAYGYDVLNRRTSRTSIAGGITNVEHFVYNGNQIIADLDGSGNLLHTYIWGAGGYSDSL